MPQPTDRLEVVEIPRQEFLTDYWDYRAGEHVTTLGFTGSGKTTLDLQLLGHIPPTIKPVILVMKPRDATVTKWQKTLGLQRVGSWPPPSANRFYPNPPNGWVLWPKLGDVDRDDDVLEAQFSAAIKDLYHQSARRKDDGSGRIIFADEVVGLCKELGLERQLKGVWTRGRSMGLGLWAASQRPAEVPLLAYNSAEHLFIHSDPDKRNLDRLKEIGGFDSQLIFNTLKAIDRHEFLYVCKRDYTACVVGR